MMENAAQQSPRTRPVWPWGVAWIGFVLVHAICMSVDLQLRDPASPWIGGLPEIVVSSVQLGSVVLLAVAALVFMPLRWPLWIRILLTLAQGCVAFGLMIFGWLFYVLENGIDTL